MAYFRLKNNIALRGWEHLPRMVCDLDSGVASPVAPEIFLALKYCDGRTDLDAHWLPGGIREIVDRLVRAGCVEACPADTPLEVGQSYKTYPNRYMSSVHWSITGRCNYRCKHCFMNAPDAKFGELPTSACLDLVDQMADCGIATISLTGGEPLVHPGFWEIIDRLSERKIHISEIYSNGALVTPRLLDGLERRGHRPIFDMSFDGVGWHDWLRGIPGAEVRVIEAFRLCRDRGLKTRAEMCLHRKNYHTLRESVLLLASLEVGSLKIGSVAPAGEWLKQDQGLILSKEELFDFLLDYIPSFFEDGAPLSLMATGLFMGRKGGKEAYIPAAKYDGTERSCRQNICSSARQTLYIGADSRALPCMSMSGLSGLEDFPKVTEMGLREVLSDSTYMRWINLRLGEFLERNERCKACEHRYVCGGGCRAESLVSGSDYLGYDPGACCIFKKGYYDRVKALIETYVPRQV